MSEPSADEARDSSLSSRFGGGAFAQAETMLGGDWPGRAADTVTKLVDGVRSKTTGPAMVVSRALVYGIVAAVFGLIALIVFLATLIRLVVSLCQGHVWLAYLILGLVFGLAGLFLWRRRWAPANN